MKPVMQTKFGVPDGNCFPSCVASIFELSLDDIPEFDGKQWWRDFCLWCKQRGLEALNVRDLDATEYAGYSIASGKSKRGYLHSVVWQDGGMVHDPHPDNTGVKGPDDFICFVVSDPSKICIGGTP